MQSSAEIELKVLVIGDAGCGKTSFINRCPRAPCAVPSCVRYVHNKFSEHYKMSLGVDFALKVIPWDSGKVNVRLQLRDIAGQERAGQMTRVPPPVPPSPSPRSTSARPRARLLSST